MDFRQTIQPNPRPTANNPQPAHGPSDDSNGTMTPQTEPTDSSKWFKLLSVVVLIGIAILIAAIAVGVGRGKTNNNEANFVNKGKYQAVFLDNGQVYFGSIQTLNSQYIRMTNIYYLTQTASSTSSSTDTSNGGSYSLVKLGCQQIHDPYDTMIINRSQVSFWENLQDNGKVVSSINKFKQQNPNGPDCSQVSNQTQATTNSTQGTGTSGAAGTGSAAKQ